jgi:hypothetical protein
VGDVTTNKVTGLIVGVNYFFAVTARATNGLESDYSNEVSYRPTAVVTNPLPTTPTTPTELKIFKVESIKK